MGSIDFRFVEPTSKSFTGTSLATYAEKVR